MNGNQDEWIIKLNQKVDRLSAEFAHLIKRVNDLEVKLDNLRVEYDHHQFHSPKTTNTRSIECENCGWFNEV